MVPICGTGPPPDPPVPKAEADARERIARRRRQAEMLKQARGIRSAQKPSGGDGRSGLLKRRFWKDVSVKEVDGEDALPFPIPSHKSCRSF